MARASTRTRIPAVYRQPLLGKPDPRLMRCLGISSGLGAIVLLGILVTPAPREEMRMDEMPRRLAKLILEPPKPAAPPRQVELARERAAEPGIGEPGGSGGYLGGPSPDEQPGDEQLGDGQPGPGTESSGGAGQRRLEATRRASSGTAGREQAGREVRESLAQTQQEVKQTLAEVTAVLSAVKSGPSSSPTSAPRRGRPAGGRARGDLEQVDVVKAAAEGTEGDGPVTAGVLDIGSITDVRSDLASADPSIAGGGGSGTGSGGGGGAGGRRGGRGSGNGSGSGSGSGNGSGTGSGNGNGNGNGNGSGAGGSSEPGAYRSNASLLAVVRRYAPGIQYCYDNELKRDLSLNGKMVLVLTVLASGEVSEVTIAQNSVGSSRLEECVLAQVREWRFPAVGDGIVTFRTPFVFTPPES